MASYWRKMASYWWPYPTVSDVSLKAIFDELLKDICIDYTSQEIKDIESSVEELTQRYVNSFNEHSDSFHIKRIQPCGSMVEKTSLWKSCSVFEGVKEHDINFIEFDYLAVIEKPSDSVYQNGCSNCLMVRTRSEKELPKTVGVSGAEWPDSDDPNAMFNFDQRFHSELHSTIEASCSCYKVKQESHSSDHRQIYRYQETSTNTTCRRCTVWRQTGCLHIATTDEARYLAKNPLDCSFILVWNSSANSLTAAHSQTLRRSEPIQFLHIFVDFLPALEIKGSQRAIKADFVVPKGCGFCERYMTWRGSNCLNEVSAVRSKLSCTHRKCYMILKCIFAQIQAAIDFPHFYPKGYHIKCSVLNHGKYCSDDGDFSKCVLKVTQDLQVAFQRGFLKSFVSDLNLIEGEHPDSLRSADVKLSAVVEALCHISSEISEWKSGRSCPFTPEKVIRRIVRTVVEADRTRPHYEH